ncbi:MAG TPA: phosphoribosylanthranilate isomerase [Candidatus Limnocylindrales bacterium]|nr:phosphoribosylanthranilate isomerase [Candidatus Limnocylindrales bacterium]
MVQIKICGIRDLETAGFCIEQGVNFLGLVFYPPSKRYINPIVARDIVRTFRDQVKFVGVFLDSPQEEVNRIAEQVELDYVQLHGKESPEYCCEILRPVIKTFGVGPGFDSTKLTLYQQNVPYYLFDNIQGGSGQIFDWTRLQRITREVKLTFKKPFFLAGGLTPENVSKAIQETSPMAVDVSSGVETEGRKDPAKIKKFVERVRGWESAVLNGRQITNPAG